MRYDFILFIIFLDQTLIEYTIEKVAGTITRVKNVAKVKPNITVHAKGPQKLHYHLQYRFLDLGLRVKRKNQC